MSYKKYKYKYPKYLCAFLYLKKHLKHATWCSHRSIDAMNTIKEIQWQRINRMPHMRKSNRFLIPHLAQCPYLHNSIIEEKKRSARIGGEQPSRNIVTFTTKLKFSQEIILAWRVGRRRRGCSAFHGNTRPFPQDTFCGTHPFLNDVISRLIEGPTPRGPSLSSLRARWYPQQRLEFCRRCNALSSRSAMHRAQSTSRGALSKYVRGVDEWVWKSVGGRAAFISWFFLFDALLCYQLLMDWFLSATRRAAQWLKEMTMSKLYKATNHLAN